MKKRFLACAMVIAPSIGLAHDFWLAASSWHVPVGASVTLTANVGDRFPKPTAFTAPERVATLELVGPAGRQPAPLEFSRQSDSLATSIQLPPQPSTYVAVMTVKPRFIEIPPADFTTYLTHEGLEAVLKERERRGEQSKPGRERYARYSKLLIRAGSGGGDHVTRPVGLKAELVPESDPTKARVGDRVAFRLMVEGKPVAGAFVGAIYARSVGAPDDWPLKGRTGPDGRLEFQLAHPGPWLIRTVHMERREGERGADAVDWESYWASLTFDLEPSVPSGRRD